MAQQDSQKLHELLEEIKVQDGSLLSFLGDMFTETEHMMLQDIGDDDDEEASSNGAAAGKKSTSRNLGDRMAQIKPVLYAEQVAIFESALRATGEPNRGKALMQICAYYLSQIEEAMEQTA